MTTYSDWLQKQMYLKIKQPKGNCLCKRSFKKCQIIIQNAKNKTKYQNNGKITGVYYDNIEKEHYSNKKTMEKTVMQETAIEI